MGDARKPLSEVKKLNRMQAENARANIQVAMLLKRLEDNAMGLIDPPLDSGQVKSIQIQLDKSMPNLSSSDLNAQVETKQTPTQKTTDDIKKHLETVEALPLKVVE